MSVAKSPWAANIFLYYIVIKAWYVKYEGQNNLFLPFFLFPIFSPFSLSILQSLLSSYPSHGSRGCFLCVLAKAWAFPECARNSILLICRCFNYPFVNKNKHNFHLIYFEFVLCLKVFGSASRFKWKLCMPSLHHTIFGRVPHAYHTQWIWPNMTIFT
jgi:hypothetical protein